MNNIRRTIRACRIRERDVRERIKIGRGNIPTGKKFGFHFRLIRRDRISATFTDERGSRQPLERKRDAIIRSRIVSPQINILT